MTGPFRRRDLPLSPAPLRETTPDAPLRETAPDAPAQADVPPAVRGEAALTGPSLATCRGDVGTPSPVSGAPVGPPSVTWRRCFPAREISVPEARDWARALLAGRVPPPLLDDTLLLLSEVVTNAVIHSDSARVPHGRVTVHITRTPGAIRVEVSDAGSATGAPAVRTPDDDGGRGLWLVDTIAAEWGCRQDETGGSVWFRLTG